MIEKCFDTKLPAAWRLGFFCLVRKNDADFFRIML